MPADPLPKLRRICLALPDATERISHGEPTWFARNKKSFAMYSNHHHDDRLAFVCAAPDGAQETLIKLRPERFYRPPYVGYRGWIGVYLDTPGIDWGELKELVTEAYGTVDPKHLN